MKKRFMAGLAFVMILAVLAGCGSVAQQSGAAASGGDTGASSESVAETSPSQGSLEVTSGEAAGAWPRTYVDALGREVVLESKPERTALLFFRNFEHMFLLGEFPIAATNVDVLDNWASLAPYKGQYDIADVGAINAPNMEKLLELEPDLIVVYSGWYDDYGRELEKIAPVIAVDSNENEWQRAMACYGEILGKETQAQAEVERIEALISDSRKELEALNEKTFAVIMLGDKQYWAFTTQFVYDKENGLGLHPPEPYVDMSSKGEEISLEGIAEMNPDYIFVSDIGGSSEALAGYLEELKSNTVWNSLDAVKNGHLYALDSSISAGGPLGIELGVRTIVDSLR